MVEPNRTIPSQSLPMGATKETRITGVNRPVIRGKRAQGTDSVGAVVPNNGRSCS